TAALVNSRGGIAWSCWPSFEDDPIFCALVNQDEKGVADKGHWAVEVKDFSHSKQFYERNTAILETHLFSHDGSAVKIIDSMPRFLHYGRTLRDKIIVRIIEPLSGTPMIKMKTSRMYGCGAHEVE